MLNFTFFQKLVNHSNSIKHILPKYKFLCYLQVFSFLAFIFIFKMLDRNLSFFFFFDSLIPFFALNYYLIKKIKNINFKYVDILILRLNKEVNEFLLEVKTLYLDKNLVSSDINLIKPEGIFVKLNPVKPKFLEAFEEITFFEKPSIIISIKKIFYTFFLIGFSLIIVVGLNYIVFNFQYVFFEKIKESFIFCFSLFLE